MNATVKTIDCIFILSEFFELQIDFLYLRDRVCSIFSGAGKFCLAHGLRQLAQDTKSDVSCVQKSFTCPNEKLPMTFRIGHHTKLIVDKNNQSLMPHADRETQPSVQQLMPETW